MSSTLISCSFYKVKKSALTATAKDQIRINDVKRKRSLAHFNFRNIQDSPEFKEPVVDPIIDIKNDPCAKPKVDFDRKFCLIKWKEDKKRKLEEERKKKKPAFKAGVVSHSIGSPYFSVASKDAKKFRVLNKHKFQFRLQSAKVLPKLTVPVAPKFSSRKVPCNTDLPDEDRRVLRSNVLKENVLPVSNQPTRNLRSNIVDRAQVRDLKAETEKILNFKKKPFSPKHALNNISNTSEQPPAKNIIFSPFSPNVCLTRGKRRPVLRNSDENDEEERERKKEGRLRARIASTHLERLDFETQRLQNRCEDWNKVAKEQVLPEDIISEIDSLSGKSRLLTSDKFMQFRRIVEQFEMGDSNPPIVADDLTGFWEMMYLQVEDLDKKFENLEGLKSNEWKQISEPKFTNQPKSSTNKPPRKVVKKPAASSSLKNFLAAARQNKEKSALPNEELKVFDAGLFQVISPVVQSPLRKKSDANTSLLRQTLCSNSKRISPRSSAINAVRKSILARSFTASPTVITNKNKATPKSILRKSTIVATSPVTPRNRKKSLRFGPSEFQSPSPANSGPRQKKGKSVLLKKELKGFDVVTSQVVSPVALAPVQKKVDGNTSLPPQLLCSNSERNSPRSLAINAMKKSILSRSFTTSPTITTNKNEATTRSTRRKSAIVTTKNVTPKNRKKSIRFGPSECQSPSPASSAKKGKKIVGTPYRAPLNETFSMDEDESPTPKAETEATPLRRSTRLSRKSNGHATPVALAF